MMLVKEISKEEFNEFASRHVLGSFYQSSEYGDLMQNLDYKPSYIGCYDNNTLKAAFLLLTKSISLNVKYGYSPRGFLLDYFDPAFLKDFTDSIKKYFSKKGYAFIKINPIITLSQVNANGDKTFNEMSIQLIENLENNNYKKLKDNLYFESILPKFNPIINLKNFNFTNLDNKLQNRINKISNKGLNLIKGDFYDMNKLYDLTHKKEELSSDFYKNLFKIFKEKDKVDLFLVETNYHDYLNFLQQEHYTEQTINEKINKLFQMDPSNKAIYNEKMNSDKKLNEINDEMSNASNKIQKGIFTETIAGALIIKYNNIAYIYVSGFNKDYNRLLPNHFLHYSLLNYYKNEGFSFMDLNGITGDFSKDNPYKGLNDFKLSWGPRVFEYIGEFDLIINQTKYSLLWSTKALHKEFEKKGLKSTN